MVAKAQHRATSTAPHPPRARVRNPAGLQRLITNRCSSWRVAFRLPPIQSRLPPPNTGPCGTARVLEAAPTMDTGAPHADHCDHPHHASRMNPQARLEGPLPPRNSTPVIREGTAPAGPPSLSKSLRATAVVLETSRRHFHQPRTLHQSLWACNRLPDEASCGHAAHERVLRPALPRLRWPQRHALTNRCLPPRRRSVVARTWHANDDASGVV